MTAAHKSTPEFATSDILSGTTHGFFGRQGGVSTGIYSGLNCGPGSADDPAAVTENRAHVCATLGRTADRLYTLHQHHSADCLIITGDEDPAAKPKADALVTARRDILLGILTADCAPVLFACHDSGIVGAAHAGWRGAAHGVLENTLTKMVELGANRTHIGVAIGPTIGPADYEIGADFVAAVTSADSGAAPFVIRHAAKPRPHFDLPGYVADRLARAGITQIDTSNAHSTYADPDSYFSYRYNCHQNRKDYGRMIAVIGMKG